MTAPRQPDHDEPVEALVADRYLEALLAAHEDATPPPGQASLDPSLAATARLLRRSLVRVHPSFRFEERLAARLADLAATQAGRTSPGTGRVIPFPGLAGGTRAADDPLLPAILAGELDPTDDALDAGPPAGIDRRPLLVGGALTSAALSIAGVAWVAWRASRPGTRTGARLAAGTMVRAARTAHARRAALDRAGLTGGTA